MPVTEPNNYYRIADLSVDHDSVGYYLTCKLIHCRNWVLCISRRGPILRADLQLTEQDLARLFKGEVLKFPELGYTLQGVSSNVFVGNPRYRNPLLSPPVYVQAWCMDADGRTLYVPDAVDLQCITVPIEYSCTTNGSRLMVKISQTAGYCDADLLYQVGSHLPIPLPKEWLNTWIPLRTTSEVRVFPAQEARERYKQTAY